MPRLRLEHTPGWKFDAHTERDPKDAYLTVFDSDEDEFNLGFTLDVFADGSVSDSLSPLGTVETCNLTADELNELAGHADRLRMWFEDLAAVTAWTTEHRAEIAAMI